MSREGGGQKWRGERPATVYIQNAHVLYRVNSGGGWKYRMREKLMSIGGSRRSDQVGLFYLCLIRYRLCQILSSADIF